MASLLVISSKLSQSPVSVISFADSLLCRMGLLSSKKPSTVCIGGYECPMTEMVEQNPKMFRSGVSLFEVCSHFRL